MNVCVLLQEEVKDQEVPAGKEGERRKEGEINEEGNYEEEEEEEGGWAKRTNQERA